MKISARDIQFANQVIAARGGIELSGAGRLKVARISRAIRAESEAIQDAMSSLLREHAQLDAAGQMVTIPTPAGPVPKLKDPTAFAAARRALESNQLEIAVEPLTQAELDEVKGDSGIIDALLPFVAKA